MKRIKAVFYLILIILTGASCENNEEYNVCVEQPDLTNVNVDLQFERLTDTFLDIQSEEQLRTFLSVHPVVKEYFLRSFDYPDENIFYAQLLQKITNPHIDTLQAEVNRIFGDETELEQTFEKAFSHLKYYYPEVKIPKVKTIATGFDQDLYVSDSLIVVGLDYYLGEGARFRPIDTYQYVLERYRPQYIVPSVMLIYGISPRFNETDLQDNTVLGDMIAYGKAFYFAKHMMPCTPDSVLIWYNTEEINGVRENKEIIWSHFVEKEILYSKSHEIKRKYIEERPKTYEIGDAAPGRIGTWLGWQIVRTYMEENPSISLPELMAKENPQEIFKASNYKPD